MSTFDRRYEIYSDAEEFLGEWIKYGRPDPGTLLLIIRAWNRSHFLSRPEVTDYLHTLWKDALRANHLDQIIAGEVDGDRDKAVKEFYELFRKHVDYEKLREVMTPDLRVSNHWRAQVRPRRSENG